MHPNHHSYLRRAATYDVIGLWGINLRRTANILNASRAMQALALACVLLVSFAGFAQAVHVHSDDSKIPSHECSICSVAHAGVLGSAIFQSIPVVAHAVLELLPEAPVKSSGFIFSLRIRPPPAV